MKKLKHSKYKNTGIVFEILTRNMVNETMYDIKPSAIRIIKKYFKEGTEIYKELKYYQTLQDVKPNLKSVDRLIDLVLTTYKTNINVDTLNSEKYKLIGELKRCYNLDIFFESRVNNYKLLASVFKLLEYTPGGNPVEHIRCRDLITDHISGSTIINNDITDVQKMMVNEDLDTKRLTFKIIVEKFNDKYSNLNENQRVLLNRFINDDTTSTDFRDFIYTCVTEIRDVINTKLNHITSEVTKIKLTESVKLLDNILASKIIDNHHMTSLLKYYELIEELK